MALYERFGKKFRIIKAIDNEDILLLTRLMTIQKHKPEDPVDKLGGTIMHMACLLGKLSVLDWFLNQFNPDINQYNSDGSNPVHCAINGGHPHILTYLYEKGADIYAPTYYFKVSPIQKCDKRIAREKRAVDKAKFVEIKNFIMEMYFIDKRGDELRKYFWVYLKLREEEISFGVIPYNLAREIGEFI